MEAQTKNCQNCKKDFTIEPEDVAFLEKFDVQSPDECVRCIWRHMAAFWVFGVFRKGKSAFSGKTIITTFSDKVKFPIYAHDEWVSDAWDPLSYGQEYDETRPFFEQFAELQAKVPHPHQTGTKNTNSDWGDDVWNSKNCYLCRAMLDCEDVSYGYRLVNCKRSFDITFCFDTELSYDCAYCFKCYKVKYSFNARDSMESAFLYDCRNVQNCFMCWNLRNKQYCILNRQYSKEGYFEKLKEYDMHSRSSVKKLKKEFAQTVAENAIHRADHTIKISNSTGNFLEECKNCTDCYFLERSENCRHIFRGFQDKDVIYGVGSIAEKAAFSMMDGYAYGTMCTSRCGNCRYSAYLDYCEECEYCFGCVGLRKKKYCILNKQYTKEEYESMILRIKEKMKRDGEWGRFFPYALAYGGYNNSVANHYFPLTKDEALQKGIQWEDPTDVAGEGKSGDNLPDRIDDAYDTIPQEQLICPRTKRRFNIAPQELAFCRAEGIPLPEEHFDYRTLERFKLLAVSVPYEGACFLCHKDITHFYPPEWGYRKIACTECYQQEVA